MSSMYAHQFTPAGAARARSVRARGRAAAVALAVLLSPMPGHARPEPDDKAADTLLAITGEGFKVRHTKHFAIAFDTPPALVGPLAARLEACHRSIRLFCERLSLPQHSVDGNLMVILYGDRPAFERHVRRLNIPPGDAVGFYHAGENVALFAEAGTHPEIQVLDAHIGRLTEQIRRLGTGRGDRDERDQLLAQRATMSRQRQRIVDRFNRLVIQHEAAHQTLYNFGVHVRGADNPTWLAEGLACQFEVPQVSSRGQINRVNHMRLADLKAALGLPLDATRIEEAQLVAALARGALLPLRSLVEKPHRLHESSASAPVRYAESWALVYYLALRHREAFGAYLRRLSERKPGDIHTPEREWEDFADSFGPVDEAFQMEWIEFIVRLPLNMREAGR